MSKQSQNWSGKSRGGYTGHLIFIFLIRHVGLRAAYVLLGFVSIYFIPFAPKATRSVWDYYRKTLHKGRFRAMWKLMRHYYLFGQTIIDRVAVENGLGDRFKYQFENYDPVRELFESHQPMILIGAHFGAPAVGADFFGTYAEKMHLVMYDAEHKRVKEALNRFGQQFKIDVIPVGKDPLASIFDIKAALDKGDCVSFMGDRFLDGNRTFEAEFLSRKAHFPQGPFLIAEKMRVPVIFYFATRERNRIYRFHFEIMPPFASKNRDGQSCFRTYLSLLEKEVRTHEGQWFNFYKFWN